MSTDQSVEAAANARALAKRRTLATVEELSEPIPPGMHNPLTDKPTPPPRSAAARRTGSASINRRRIVERDGARREFQVDLEEDETYQEASQPAFLGLKADAFRPGDIIRFVGHEMSFIADHVVIKRDEPLKSVTTIALSFIDLRDKIATAAAYDYSLCRIEANNTGWRIVHGNSVVADGFASEAAARKWLRRRAQGDENA